MDEAKKLFTNAEIAFVNKQYQTALEWYQKVLENMPNDIYVLSRAGAICVPLGKFEEALLYFGRALKLDPDNGDNAFNYGNACFFNKDYVKAFEHYVEAEKVGCSDDVKPRLYYQMALLCSMRQDIKSSLIYFKKCEESDKTGMISLNPDLISEKLKLYMVQQDYANAEKCAAQLVAISPTEFKGYMVYFSILMAHKKYSTAEKLLKDAEAYAELSPESRFALSLQRASLYVTMSEENSAEREAYIGKAIAELEKCAATQELTGEQLAQLNLALAETFAKVGSNDRAIYILADMLAGTQSDAEETLAEAPATGEHELSWDELYCMLDESLANIENLICNGWLDPDMGMYVLPEYDDNGMPVHYYDQRAFGMEMPLQPEEEMTHHEKRVRPVLSPELREKAMFSLLTCYLAKDSFSEAEKIAKVLKHSKNKYYGYYGLYVSTMAYGKINGDSETTRRKYAEAIAFFRNKSFSDAADTLASIFRARLYAEQKKFEKAAEIAWLLSESDRKSVLAYIEQCR